MPRTFSRGKKFTVDDLVFRFTQYLSVEDGEEYLRLIRQIHCPEQPLIEQDIFDQLNQLRKNLFNLFDHFRAFHSEQTPSHDIAKMQAHAEAVDPIINSLDAFNIGITV